MDYGKLKTYYESIDRVTVPFVYPQYWDKDKEEWVVVDKNNRLPVDARLTGSNVEEVFFERFIFNGEDDRYQYAFPPDDVRGAIVTVIIHGATGDYSDGRGFRPRLLNYTFGSNSSSLATEIKPEWTKADTGVYQFYLYPGIDLKDADTRASQNKFYVSHTFVSNFLGLFLDLDGNVGAGEGYDISAHVMWLK